MKDVKATAPKRQHPALENYTFLNFFLILWIIYAFSFPDVGTLLTKINADSYGYRLTTLEKTQGLFLLYSLYDLEKVEAKRAN